jgi:hypothetical protein
MNNLWSSIRNLIVVTKPFLLVAVVTIVLSFVVFNFIQTKFPTSSGTEVQVKYLEQYVNLIQILTIGVAVTLISVIIPHMLPEARDKFERYKESRLAYSRAKTAVLYLADRVVNVDRKEAFLLIEEAHRQLHFAETFKDVIIKKGYLKWFGNPSLWIPYNYWQIFAVAGVLRKYDWETSESKDSLKNNLYNTLEVVHGHFGRTGEKCKEVSKEKRSDFENKVEVKIKNVLDQINNKNL